jgi:hypothetical protein
MILERRASSPAPRAAASARGVEIRVRWGASVLHVAQRTPPRSFHAGEAGLPRCDCLVPAALLGVRRAPVILADGDAVGLVVLAGATGTIALPGREEASLREIVEGGRGRRHMEIRGALEIALPPGSRAVVTLGDLVFEVAYDLDGPVVARSLATRAGALFPMALSFAAHTALLAAAAVYMPPLGEIVEDDVATVQTLILDHRLVPIADADPNEAEKERRAMEGVAADLAAVYTKCGEDHGGTMGELSASMVEHRYGVEGPADNPDPHISHDVARDPSPVDAIGLHAGSYGAAPGTPIAPWGRDDALGNDRSSARARMWGEDIAMSFGVAGTGVGIDMICDKCGASGQGTAIERGARGGATGSEKAMPFMLAVLACDDRP